MKILADANMAGVKALFRSLGEVTLFTGRGLASEQLVDVDCLLVRSVTQVNAELLKYAQQLRFVGTATSGYDHVDLALLAERDIAFAHAPGSNADSVVDYVLSVLCHHPAQLDQLLAGAPIGIVGFGTIGRRLARRLARLGIGALAYDPWLEADSSANLTALDAVLSCPVVSLHAALTDAAPWPSRQLLKAAQLAQMSPDSVLINAARGELVATEELLSLADQRPDIGLVLDCWENEPAISDVLLRISRFATPHIAGYSYDGKLRATQMLYHAACQALSLTGDPAAGALAPKDVDAPAGLDDQTLLPWLVEQVYDVRDDDEALRQSPMLFDQLRRQYRQRRELSSLRLRNASILDEASLSICKALGVDTC